MLRLIYWLRLIGYLPPQEQHRISTSSYNSDIIKYFLRPFRISHVLRLVVCVVPAKLQIFLTIGDCNVGDKWLLGTVRACLKKEYLISKTSKAKWKSLKTMPRPEWQQQRCWNNVEAVSDTDMEASWRCETPLPQLELRMVLLSASLLPPLFPEPALYSRNNERFPAGKCHGTGKYGESEGGWGYTATD